CSVLGCLCTRLPLSLIQQIFKHSAITLKTHRAHVGQVVGDSGELFVLRGQPGFADVECGVHSLLSLDHPALMQALIFYQRRWSFTPLLLIRIFATDELMHWNFLQHSS